MDLVTKLSQTFDDLSLIGRENLDREVIGKADVANGLLIDRKLVRSDRPNFDGIKLTRC